MRRKIAALIDGSAYSASVCELAAWISGRTDVPVELLHVLGRREAPDRHDMSGSIRLGARTTLMKELAELDSQRARLVAQQGRAILEDAHGILTERGVTEITTRLRHGDLVEAVSEAEADADLVIIGKRGEASGFAKGHLGSNLERIVRASHRPVFVASREIRPLRKVLVAYDGGASAMKAVDHMSRNALFSGLAVHVVTVGTSSPEVTRGLEDACSLLKGADIDAETRVISGQPETALGKMVDQDAYDMVVMGAYGHSRVRQMIIGSTTTEMIRTCKVPIVLIR